MQHSSDKRNPILATRNIVHFRNHEDFARDGLNSANYTVLKYEHKPFYTWILVDLFNEQAKPKPKGSLLRVNQ